MDCRNCTFNRQCYECLKTDHFKLEKENERLKENHDHSIEKIIFTCGCEWTCSDE